MFLKLKPGRAHGPDATHNKFLKEIADQIAPFVARLFQQSTDTCVVPLDWKNANISALFKEGDRLAAVNYRTVSPTSV